MKEFSSRPEKPGGFEYLYLSPLPPTPLEAISRPDESDEPEDAFDPAADSSGEFDFRDRDAYSSAGIIPQPEYVNSDDSDLEDGLPDSADDDLPVSADVERPDEVDVERPDEAEDAVERLEAVSERPPVEVIQESRTEALERLPAEEVERLDEADVERPDELEDAVEWLDVVSERPPVEVIRESRTEARERPPAEALERVWRDQFEGLRQEGEAGFTAESWKAELDRQRETAELQERVDGLIGRLAGLPLIPGGAELVRRLEKLSRSDVGRCLRLIGETLADLAPDRAPVVSARDPAAWVELLEQSVQEVQKLGAPTIVVLPAPDGRIDGRMPRREVTDVEVLRSRGVMFGADATLTVVHHCTVERPVIEIAALIDSAEAGASWEAWRCEPSAGPDTGTAAAGIRPRIVDCAAVSIGDGNTQHNVFEHRMSECPVNLGVLLADEDIREALVLCRNESLGDVERIEARARLRRIVTRVVKLTDVSALIPDEVIARQASAAADARPGLRSRGAALTVMHGMGVAIGWGTTTDSRTTTRVGRFQIR